MAFTFKQRNLILSAAIASSKMQRIKILGKEKWRRSLLQHSKRRLNSNFCKVVQIQILTTQFRSRQHKMICMIFNLSETGVSEQYQILSKNVFLLQPVSSREDHWDKPVNRSYLLTLSPTRVRVGSHSLDKLSTGHCISSMQYLGEKTVWG